MERPQRSNPMDLQEKMRKDINLFDITPTSASAEHKGSGVTFHVELRDGKAVFTDPEVMNISSILREAMREKAFDAMMGATQLAAE